MLLRTLSNAAYGSLRLAQRVKFDEKNIDDHPFNLSGYHAQIENLSKSLFDKGL